MELLQPDYGFFEDDFLIKELTGKPCFVQVQTSLSAETPVILISVLTLSHLNLSLFSHFLPNNPQKTNMNPTLISAEFNIVRFQRE